MTKRQLIVLALVLLAACALPFVVSNYRVFQFTLVLVYSIALLGLNILTGYNGQISLGHGAFYAIGAYVAAMLIDKLGVPTPGNDAVAELTRQIHAGTLKPDISNLQTAAKMMRG